MLIRRGHAVHVSVVFALVLHYTCHPGCWDCRRSCVSDLSSSACWFGVDTILPTTESPTFSFHLRQNLTGRVSLRDNSADSFFEEPLLSGVVWESRFVAFVGFEHFSRYNRCRTSRIKVKRSKCQCAYYSNSTVTFQCPLQGDLVFKLNPGPTDHQSTIHTHVTHHRAPLSSRTRNYSNLITVNRAPLTKHSNTPFYTSFTANAPTFRIPVVTPGTRLVRQRNTRNNNNLRPLTQSNGNAIQDHHSIALDFCLLNAQSLNNKAGEFTALVCEYKPDLVALTETWFYPMESASRPLCTPAGYKLLDYPRTSRTGGGTGVLFSDNLTVKKWATAELRSFEYSEWDIKSETDRIHLIIIYRTPYSDAHPVTTSVFFEEFSSFLESAVFCSSHLLITGDFNIHMDVEDDTDAVRLRGLLESTGLKQHVTVPTHISGHTLDLVITRLSDQLGISTPWTDYLFSDHMPVYSKLQVCKPALKRSHITFRKIGSINKKLLRDEISEADLCINLLSYNLDGLVNAYNNTLKSALDHHAPVITKTIVKRPTVPWFNDGVKSAKKEKRRAERKWRRTRLHSDLLDFKAKKNLATCVIKRARSDYYTNFIQENCSDSRKLFRSAKTLFDQEVDLNFTGYHDNRKLANDIGKFFVQKIERI